MKSKTHRCYLLTFDHVLLSGRKNPSELVFERMRKKWPSLELLRSPEFRIPLPSFEWTVDQWRTFDGFCAPTVSATTNKPNLCVIIRFPILTQINSTQPAPPPKSIVVCYRMPLQLSSLSFVTHCFPLVRVMYAKLQAPTRPKPPPRKPRKVGALTF